MINMEKFTFGFEIEGKFVKNGSFVGASNIGFNSTDADLGCDGCTSTGEIRNTVFSTKEGIFESLHSILHNFRNSMGELKFLSTPMASGRPCGIHIHIGGKTAQSMRYEGTKKDILGDLYDLVFCYIMTEYEDREGRERREEYGKFFYSNETIRAQAHGLEYRSLSSIISGIEGKEVFETLIEGFMFFTPLFLQIANNKTYCEERINMTENPSFLELARVINDLYRSNIYEYSEQEEREQGSKVFLTSMFSLFTFSEEGNQYCQYMAELYHVGIESLQKLYEKIQAGLKGKFDSMYTPNDPCLWDVMEVKKGNYYKYGKYDDLEKEQDVLLCASCSEEINRSDSHESPYYGGRICDTCRDNVFTCYHCDEEGYIDDMNCTGYDYNYYCNSCFNSLFTYCNHCDQYVNDDDIIIVRNIDGESCREEYCISCLENEGLCECENCYNWTREGQYCNDCNTMIECHNCHEEVYEIETDLIEDKRYCRYCSFTCHCCNERRVNTEKNVIIDKRASSYSSREVCNKCQEHYNFPLAVKCFCCGRKLSINESAEYDNNSKKLYMCNTCIENERSINYLKQTWPVIKNHLFNATVTDRRGSACIA